jgi:hypothetical protein
MKTLSAPGDYVDAENRGDRDQRELRQLVSMAGDAVRRLGEPTCEGTAVMNANYGYQLYQAGKGRGRGIMVIIAGRTARAA